MANIEDEPAGTKSRAVDRHSCELCVVQPQIHYANVNSVAIADQMCN